MEYIQIIGGIITVIGSLVLLVASIGLIRMPDSYNRIQVGTKASTLAISLIMVGLIFIVPSWFGKLLTILMFVMLTNPISSNVLMKASHKMGEPLAKVTVIDQLKEDEDNEINLQNGTI